MSIGEDQPLYQPKPMWLMLIEPWSDQLAAMTADVQRFVHECNVNELESLHTQLGLHMPMGKQDQDLRHAAQLLHEYVKQELATRRRPKRRSANGHQIRNMEDQVTKQFVLTCECGWAKRFDMYIMDVTQLMREHINNHLIQVGAVKAPIHQGASNRIMSTARQAGKTYAFDHVHSTFDANKYSLEDFGEVQD